MPKIRVLVADDSVVIRRLLTDTIGGDPDMEVVGVAANGRIALAKIPQVNPDVITLDIEMPDMDGITALKEIRKLYPRLPVIMFSTLTERGAAITLDALSLGANDYVTKPANVGSVSTGMQRLRDELVPKIKAHCAKIMGPIAPALSTLSIPPRPAIPRQAGNATTLGILAIGVSTGGPNALAELMPSFPKDFPVPIVIVQHMPPMFTRLLAERLDTNSSIRVYEGKADSLLQPGVAWIAPGDYHMIVKRDGLNVRLALNQNPPENSCRPAVDVLFRSVASVYGAQTLAVVLTGMGQDGLRGCEQIREAGGQILAQDEASSVVWGMPGFVAKAGLADKILPLSDLGEEIKRRVSMRRQAMVVGAVRT